LRALDQRFGVPHPEREPPARTREPLSPAVEQVTKALDEHERLATLKAERARADQELAAARERLQGLNGAMERVRQASQRFDAALARVYRDPAAARARFTRTAVEIGTERAVAVLGTVPEQ